ncbi:MAG: hypothetical protein WDN24_12410 [Sphingomonas sp.]
MIAVLRQFVEPFRLGRLGPDLSDETIHFAPLVFDLRDQLVPSHFLPRFPGLRRGAIQLSPVLL